MYEKGRRKEYKIVNLFKSWGYNVAQRTAGSHSPFDVIAINSKEKVIKLVQCKPDTMPMSKIRKILKENENLEGDFKVEFEVR
jgi:Holliday junction resolvase